MTTTGTKSREDVDKIRDDIERPADGIGFPRTLRRLVQGKNIHADTLLATDYLNHFNEIVMLLELVPDMPECLDDALEWRPKSYEDHFEDSSFQDKVLAILAYENAPRRYREPFDQLVKQMNVTVASSLSHLQQVVAGGDMEHARHVVSTVSKKMQRYVDVASAVIHGRALTSGQEEIDTLLAEIEIETGETLSTGPVRAAAKPARPSLAELWEAQSQDDIDVHFG